MENKEKRNQRIVALIAVILLASAYFAFGQDVKARPFADDLKSEYDYKAYFNVSLLVYSDDVIEETDSVEIFIRERNGKTGVGFWVSEKTDFYFAYDKFYEVFIRRKGYSVAYLCVNAGVKVKEYTILVPVYLEPKEIKHQIGIIVWDTRINDIHYYPEKLAYK